MAARRREQEKRDIIWCADVQAGSEACDYLDEVHYAPKLSRRTAACITAGLALPVP
jgi:hypothetical protein